MVNELDFQSMFQCASCGAALAVSGAVSLPAATATLPRAMVCGGCRVARYCSATCQKADWPTHKEPGRRAAANFGGAAGRTGA
jgi:hypothetical protein